MRLRGPSCAWPKTQCARPLWRRVAVTVLVTRLEPVGRGKATAVLSLSAQATPLRTFLQAQAVKEPSVSLVASTVRMIVTRIRLGETRRARTVSEPSLRFSVASVLTVLLLVTWLPKAAGRAAASPTVTTNKRASSLGLSALSIVNRCLMSSYLSLFTSEHRYTLLLILRFRSALE